MKTILAAQMGYGAQYMTEAIKDYEAEHGRPEGMARGEPEASFHTEPEWDRLGPIWVTFLRRIVSGNTSPELLEEIRAAVAEFDGE
jgi:hypothetical protein